MDTKCWIFLLFTINVFISGQCTLKQELTGRQWKIANGNQSINVQGTVPGGIYSDLMSAGVIEDIYYRFNDIKYRWIANETWTYSYTFQAENGHFSKYVTNLVFDGLDTFSTVYLNGNVIGNSSNMFVQYVFNIKPYLKTGKNNITIQFQSSVHEARRLFEAQAKRYPILPFCVPPEYNGECHANHIRKMQASFSWDWGPAFPSVGIWKPVYIESYNSAIIRDVTVNITENNEHWNIHLRLYFETGRSKSPVTGLVTTDVSTDFNNVSLFTTVAGTADETGEYVQNITVLIPKAHVSLWWPNGFGKQRLYNLKCTFAPANGEEPESVKSLRIGFRKIELIQKNISNGLTFYFKVNDLAIFAKGSNWIPANILPERGADVKRIRFLLQSARDVHMNMLRVWGGGVYESDEFYEMADELGILIWQDFMFACSMYPVDETFLKSVRAEVKHQVRRLQHHASVALWAGNNENEAALQGNWYGTRSNFTLYKQDYVTLYVNTVRDECLKNDDSRAFLVSSPTNGLQSEKEGYVARNPYDTHYGDIHYYNYILDGWNKNIYLKTRFASEYGFQSLPAYSTLLSSTNVTADLIINSEFLNSRQHHNGGYLEMAMLMNKHMNLPDNTKENYLETYSYYSQISQAMAVKAQTEFYREGRSTIDANGNGLTMGALYWQLNDVWPAPSWSSIDFRQKWKMLHYYARHFFAPVILTANISPARLLTLFAISDLTTFTPNATVTVSIYKWSSLKPIYTENNTVNFLPGYSSIIVQFWLDKNLEAVGCGSAQSARNYCFLYFSLYDSKGEQLGPDSFLFPTVIKDAVGLISPNLLVRVSKGSDSTVTTNKFNLTVTTDNIALFVWVDASDIDGIFSDNGFMQVTKYKTIQFESTVPITAARLQSSLKVTSLMSKEHL